MNGPPLHHIAERTMNRPLLIHPDKAAIILEVLGGRFPGVTAAVEAPSGPDASRFFGSHSRDGRAYSLTRGADGVAIVSIVGSLVNRGAWIGANSGLVSYEGISAQLDDAAADSEIHSIVLDLDSPGGEALGMAALAARVREINAVKPVVAVVNDMAASAAYGIASGASRIVVSPTSITGSIGVVLMHADRSGEMAERGVAVTLIHAGAHKVDGHPFGPLPEGVKASLQEEVQRHYRIFTELVAEGRGSRLSTERARATEAKTFLGADAIDAGLADEVGTFAQTVAALAATSTAPRRGSTQHRRDSMSPNAEALAERERIKNILDTDEGKANPGLAAHFAFSTDMSAEMATAALRAAGPSALAGPAEERVPTIAERAAAMTEVGPGFRFQGAPKSWSDRVFATAGVPKKKRGA